MSRQEFIDAVRAQAWDDGKECPTCEGSGKVYPGRRIVHCTGSFTGADWDEDSVIAEIETAREVRWLVGPEGGHNLGVRTAEDKIWRFQVTHPAVAEVFAAHLQGPRPDGSWGCACGWEQDKSHREHVADMVRATITTAAQR